MSRKRSRKLRPLIIILIVALLGGGTYIGCDFFLEEPTPPPDTDYPTVEFHFIDVGQGDAALIRTPNGDILIDAGTNSSEDELRAYLDALGVKELTHAIFTHPHEDHIGGADMVISTYKTATIILPDTTSTSVTFSRMLDAIEASVEANGTTVVQAEPGYTFALGDVRCEILAPIGTSYSGANNYSITLRVDYGETSVLYTGDAETKSEAEMLDRYATIGKLDCDILKVGHHGSDTSSGEDFLKAVTPTHAVISVGEGNSYGHPMQAILARLTARGATIYRTDESGSIVFKSNRGEPERVAA